MAEPTDPELDRRKVQTGLVIVSLVVVVAVVLFVLIDDQFGRGLMLAVATFGIVRAYLLSRSLRGS